MSMDDPQIKLQQSSILKRRHNGRDGVSNHQPPDCLLNRLFKAQIKETSKLCVTGLCDGNSPMTGEFPAQMASNAENVSIWWRHHRIKFSLGFHKKCTWKYHYMTHVLYFVKTRVVLSFTLRWRHNDHAGVSNHQPHGCLLNRLFRRKSKKTSKLRVTGLCAGNSPGTGEFPAQMASYAENVSIWWRHHDVALNQVQDIANEIIKTCDITWAPRCVNPRATWQFIQQLVKIDTNEYIKTLH